jgi:long-chain fatty acid transport protein
MKLPSHFGLGVAWQASENWLLAADFAYTRWSEFDDFDIKISRRQIGLSFYPTWQSLLSDLYLPMDWEDKFRLAAGAEGLLSERWTIRMGYAFDQSPIPDETFSQLFMDTGNKHHFSLGAKFLLNESVSFEGAVEAILYGERTIDRIEDVNGDGHFDNFGGTFKNTAFTSTWAFNYSF